MKIKAILGSMLLAALISGCGTNSTNLVLSARPENTSYTQKTVQTCRFSNLKVKGFNSYSDGRGGVEMVLVNETYGITVGIQYTSIPTNPGIVVSQVRYLDSTKSTLFAVDPGTSYGKEAVMDKRQLTDLESSLESELKVVDADTQNNIKGVLNAIRYQAGK